MLRFSILLILAFFASWSWFDLVLADPSSNKQIQGKSDKFGIAPRPDGSIGAEKKLVSIEFGKLQQIIDVAIEQERLKCESPIAKHNWEEILDQIRENKE